MLKSLAERILITNAAATLVTTAAGILVAIPATVSYSILTARVEALADGAQPDRIFSGSEARLETFRFAQKLPLKSRFSRIPTFALIAAPMLASVVAIWMAFEPYETPKGLAVDLLPIGPLRGDYISEPVFVSVIAGENGNRRIRLNFNEIPAGRLEDVARQKLQRLVEPRAFVEADPTIEWNQVADIIDRVEALQCRVILLTTVPAREAKQSGMREFPIARPDTLR